MAFKLRSLSVLAYANGFTLWHYKAGQDEQHTVGATGFFNDAGDMLSSGDMMMVSASNGGSMMCVLSEAAGVRTAPLG